MFRSHGCLRLFERRNRLRSQRGPQSRAVRNRRQEVLVLALPSANHTGCSDRSSEHAVSASSAFLRNGLFCTLPSLIENASTEFSDLATFLAVAGRGCIMRAAKDAGTVQLNVAKWIRALKVEIGVPRFERYSRGMTLSAAAADRRKSACCGRSLQRRHCALGGYRLSGRAAWKRKEPSKGADLHIGYRGRWTRAMTAVEPVRSYQPANATAARTPARAATDGG